MKTKELKTGMIVRNQFDCCGCLKGELCIIYRDRPNGSFYIVPKRTFDEWKERGIYDRDGLDGGCTCNEYWIPVPINKINLFVKNICQNNVHIVSK